MKKSSTRARSQRSTAKRSNSSRNSRGTAQTRSQRTRSAQSRSRSASSTGQQQRNITIDHDEIREWIEARGGTPATVEGTERGAEAAGLLRIDFPGYSGKDTLSPLDWDEFFEKFEESKLAFLHDSKPKSRFSKFIARGNKRF
jgi:hypothetical protein